MALSSTAPLITIQSGAGAVQSPANGAVTVVDQGAVLTIALAVTSGIQKWSLQFICPSYSALHLKTFDWLPGMNNAWQVALPAEAIGPANSAAGVQIVSTVSDGSGGSVPSNIFYLQTKGAGASATPMNVYADYVLVAALPTYTNVGGVLTGSAVGAITSTMADGQTPAVGDIFLLEHGLAASAADAGLYQIVTVGHSGTIKFVAQAIGYGQSMCQGTEIHVAKGTVYAGTEFVNTLAGTASVIGTASFTFYCRSLTFSSALVSGVVTAGASATSGAPADVGIMSASQTQLILMCLTVGGTVSSTVKYQYKTSTVPTVGGFGTGSISGMAAVAAGTVEASDTSTMVVTILNPC